MVRETELLLRFVLDLLSEPIFSLPPTHLAILSAGGPYQVPELAYTEWACLDDGWYNFTIYDSYARNASSPVSISVSTFFVCSYKIG